MTEDENKSEYSETYEFINGFVLEANVNKSTGKQNLIIKHLNERGEIDDLSKISCIHTAITSLSLEEFNNFNEEYFETGDRLKILYSKSSEGKQIVELTPDEKFKAFKSWTAGIAEMGIKSFFLQSEIEDLAHFSTPISLPLMKFIAKHNINILLQYLSYLSKNCIFNGEWHYPSLRANLLPFKKLLLSSDTSYILIQNFKNAFFTLKFPLSIIKEVLGKHIELKDLLKKGIDNNYNNSEITEIFKCDSVQIRSKLANLQETTNYESYNELFKDPDVNVRIITAKNPSAPKLQGYKELFNDPDWNVRRAVVNNPNSKKEYKEDYMTLFPPEWGNNKLKIIFRKQAVNFKEYRWFFFDPDPKIRYYVAQNKNAPYFKEFIVLINDPIPQIRKKALNNPNALLPLKEIY